VKLRIYQAVSGYPVCVYRTDLVVNAELLQNSRKLASERQTRMRLCQFNDVKKDTHRLAICLEMDSDGSERAMIRGSPTVCCEVKLAFVVLRYVDQLRVLIM
jgi:hypothetical protein